MIGSEVLIGILQYIFYKSTIHFYKWTYPDVFKIKSPVVEI